MRKAFGIALVLFGLTAGPAAALEIKNIHSTYGPFGGVKTGNKMLPGDILWLAFDIENLSMESDSGLVKYNVKLEVSDGKPTVIFKRDTPNQRYLGLGKGRLSERAQVIIGTEQPLGKYTVRITVTDQGGKDKAGPSKSFTQEFEIIPMEFGLIHAWCPSVAVTNQPEFNAHCKVVGMARDAKKMPNLELRMRVLDEGGKPVLPKPFISYIPKDLPPAKDLPEGFDITKEKMIPLPFPLFLNRVGRFTIEIEAIDHIGKKSTKVAFPLLVLETSTVGAQ